MKHMEKYQTLLYEARDSVGVLTLNRPERINAINEAMIEDLEGFWATRRNDEDVRIIIMKGAGEKGFCSGIDLKDSFPRLAGANIKLIYLSVISLVETA